MRRVLFVCIFLIAALPVANTAGATAAQAAGSEQVVFSGTGFGSSGPFGFWVWCEADSSNPYAGFCNGAMYFYALHLTQHVSGTISEGQTEDMYTMAVQSRDGSIMCWLTNSVPVMSGPNNTVWATCSNPASAGMSASAVVNVTQ